MALNKKIFKHKRAIMLSLIGIAVVICILATYITGYQVNKVEAEDVFEEILTEDYLNRYTEASSDEFLANFDEFHIYESYYLEPYDSTKGYREFKLSVTKSESYNIKNDIKVTIGLGANWVNYKALSSNKQVSINPSKVNADKVYWTIDGISKDHVFPIKGGLWFTKAKEPTLYVLVEWTDMVGKNNNKYTILEFDYETFQTNPTK